MTLKIKILNKRHNYDGMQIRPLWAFEELGIQGSSIVVFRGGMSVSREQMRDLKDKRERKEIRGEDLMHFIVEIIEAPGNLKLAYFTQRLLLCTVKDALEKHGVNTARESGDLYFKGRKLCVSVASSSLSGHKIHLGINITSKQAPEEARAIGLKEINKKIKPLELASIIANQFAVELEDIDMDTAKTRTF